MNDTYFECIFKTGLSEDFKKQCNYFDTFSGDMIVFKAKDFENNNEYCLAVVSKDDIHAIKHVGICEKLYDNIEILKGDTKFSNKKEKGAKTRPFRCENGNIYLLPENHCVFCKYCINTKYDYNSIYGWTCVKGLKGFDKCKKFWKNGGK